MGRVSGKVAVVTGGASGIGKEACFLLAREGAKVVVVDMDEGGASIAAEISRTGDAIFIKLDVTDESSVEKAFAEVKKKFGRLDILVNNAGITGVRKPTHEITEEEWDHVMDVNVKGVFYCTKHAIPQMKTSGGGSIINVASVIGLVAYAAAPPYVASKAAVRLMSKADALVYAKDGIRVNALVPGYVWTPLIENALKAKGDVDAGKKALEALHPVGHLGEPLDIAYGILYLASDESKFVTGSDLVIDGGYTAQ
ncbi:MAG: glucose 1-dehydrogenase [Deltaproteobacteria bacterium]|nr:glucose 1-dehydrogenase [Deltaproteobacteria bacterium]